MFNHTLRCLLHTLTQGTVRPYRTSVFFPSLYISLCYTSTLGCSFITLTVFFCTGEMQPTCKKISCICVHAWWSLIFCSIRVWVAETLLLVGSCNSLSIILKLTINITIIKINISFTGCKPGAWCAESKQKQLLACCFLHHPSKLDFTVTPHSNNHCGKLTLFTLT